MLKIPCIYNNVSGQNDRNIHTLEQIKRITTGEIIRSEAVNIGNFIGCSKSHIKMLKLAKSKFQDEKYVMIAEDNWECQDVDSLVDSFNHLCEDVPDFNMCKVANMLKYTNHKYQTSKYYTKYTTGSCTLMYIVNVKYCNKLIDIFRESIHKNITSDTHIIRVKDLEKWYVLCPLTIYPVIHKSNNTHAISKFDRRNYIIDTNTLLRNIPTIIIGKNKINAPLNIIHVTTDYIDAIRYAYDNNLFKVLIISDDIVFNDFEKTEKILDNCLRKNRMYSILKLYENDVKISKLHYYSNSLQLQCTKIDSAFIIPFCMYSIILTNTNAQWFSYLLVPMLLEKKNTKTDNIIKIYNDFMSHKP